MRPLTLGRLLFRCGILAVILFVVVVIALKMGAVQVSLYGLGRDLIRVLLGQSSAISTDYGMIVRDIRLPRILLGIVVGASLSVAGTSFQALLRNPLADPYVLGVSSGAAVGAIVALIIESHLALSPELAGLITPFGAFLGAALTIGAVYFLGRRDGQIDSSTLLLGGIITASFLSAIIMFLMNTLSGSNLRGTVFWLMGDLSTPQPRSLLYLLSFGFLAAAGAIYTTASDLNLLLAGEKEAMHLGVDVPRVRIVVYLAASILTGKAVQIVPAADTASRSFVVKIELAADPRLRSGLFGRAQFSRGGRKSLLIPHGAVIERGQLQGVFVVDRKQVAGLRYVTLGKTQGGNVEVLAGLGAGEHVVSNPGSLDLTGKRIEVSQ